jgi:hypothetical protein
VANEKVLLAAAAGAALVGAAVALRRRPAYIDLGGPFTVQADDTGLATLLLDYSTNIQGPKTWEVLSGPGQVTIQEVSLDQLLLQFFTPGTYELRASADLPGGLRVTAHLTVTVTPSPAPVELRSIEVVAPQSSVELGQTLQLQAFGNYSDGSRRDITASPLLTWTSSSPGIAQVDATGLVRGLAAGSVTITAGVGAISNIATLAVTAPAPPMVNAGPDHVVRLPDTLVVTYSVTGAGPISTEWSLVSGPAPVQDVALAPDQTRFTFTRDGAYVLRLTATNPGGSSFDDLAITVEPALPPPVLAWDVDSVGQETRAVPNLVHLQVGQSGRLTLRNGSARIITLLGLQKEVVEVVQADLTSGTFTFRATADVSIDGEVHRMGVAMDQPYTIARGVRLYAMRSNIFNSDQVWSVPWAHDLTLMVTDASLDPFNVSLYHYPLDQIWGLNLHAGREAYSGRHHDGYDIGSPWQASPPPRVLAHMDGRVWSFGPVYGGAEPTNNRLDLAPANSQFAPSRSSYFHVARLAPGIAVGQVVTKGTYIADAGLISMGGYSHLHWQGAQGSSELLINEFPLMREAYYRTMLPQPKYAGYIKDWLVTGPWTDPDPGRLNTNFLGPAEGTVTPSEGDPAGADTWRPHDNLIPGVVDLASALSPAPYSGYAEKVQDSYPNSVAYAHVYINSPAAQNVQLWLGFNDSIRVWLNGNQVFEQDRDYLYDSMNASALVVDQVKLPMQLQAGWNRLLLKLANDSNDITPGGHWFTPDLWQFSCKLALDAAGNPVPGLTLALDNPVPAPTGMQWLSTQGNRIVDEQGQTVVLRGANVESREWNWGGTHVPFYERRALPLLTGAPGAGWGANLVLLAVASGPIVRNDPDYLSVLDELVALSRANGAYTLLVYRYDEPNADLVPQPDPNAAQAMATLAQRYVNEPAVLYGLQVEALDTPWTTLKPLYIQMIDAIRAVHPRSLVFVPGTQWSRFIYWALDDGINRPNLVWKTHPYDSWGAIQASYRLDQVSAQFPVLLGEFGPGDFMNQADVDNLLDYAESRGISWCAWLFQSVGCPCLFSSVSPSFVENTYGASIKTRLQATYTP